MTAHHLQSGTERPRRVKMLMRDFIHGTGRHLSIRSLSLRLTG
jgi:hypothetical protein